MQDSEETLARVRTFSKPLTAVLWFALGFLVWVAVTEIVTTLLFFHNRRAWYPVLSFTGAGLNILASNRLIPDGDTVPLDTVPFAKRCLLALLIAVCAASRAPVLIHLRSLFSLYSQGVIFAEENAAKLKSVGLWLMASAVIIYLCGWLFAAVTGVPGRAGPVTTLTAIAYGAMVYVIARVMELGRDADLERKDFI